MKETKAKKPNKLDFIKTIYNNDFPTKFIRYFANIFARFIFNKILPIYKKRLIKIITDRPVSIFAKYYKDF